MKKLKEDFDMATSHFIVLRDDLTATQMREIEERMENLDGVTSVLSYHAMLGTGIPDFFVPEELRQMLRQDGWQLMMVNSSYEPATDQVSAQLDEMHAILHDYDPDAMITGEGAMYRDLIETARRGLQRHQLHLHRCHLPHHRSGVPLADGTGSAGGHH